MLQKLPNKREDGFITYRSCLARIMNFCTLPVLWRCKNIRHPQIGPTKMLVGRGLAFPHRDALPIISHIEGTSTEIQWKILKVGPGVWLMVDASTGLWVQFPVPPKITQKWERRTGESFCLNLPNSWVTTSLRHPTWLEKAFNFYSQKTWQEKTYPAEVNRTLPFPPSHPEKESPETFDWHN